MRARCALALVLAQVLVLGSLGACATAPTSGAVAPPRPPPDVVQGERDQVASTQADMARRALAAGRLHEALWRWHAVEAVSREPTEARREAAAVTARMSAEADADVARGVAASRNRDAAGAAAAFQQALALDPRRAPALDYLREAETASVLRAVAQEQSAAAHKRRPARKKGE